MSILLVAGLGNPGKEYEQTRHNIGFLVVDALARHLGLNWQSQRGFKSETARWETPIGRPVLFAKPQTYMNNSGEAVQSLSGYFKIAPDAIAAVYDDLTLEVGRLKVTTSGSSGGHNGVASLITHIGPNFARLKIGIGPKSPPEIDLKDFVLGKFTSEQQTIIDKSIKRYTAALRLLVEQGADRAMNQLNRREIQ